MDKNHISIKLWRGTLTKLRLLAGIKEQSIVSILDELISRELDMVSKEEGAAK